MIQVIQESSVDCIQNSRDNIVLNEDIRFDDKIQGEWLTSGIDASQLQTIDTKQLTAEFMYFIVCVCYWNRQTNVCAYYFMKDKDTKDIRYIREKGSLMGILNPFCQFSVNFHRVIWNLNWNTISLFQYLYKVSIVKWHRFKQPKLTTKSESIDHLSLQNQT